MNAHLGIGIVESTVAPCRPAVGEVAVPGIVTTGAEAVTKIVTGRRSAALRCQAMDAKYLDSVPVSLFRACPDQGGTHRAKPWRAMTVTSRTRARWSRRGFTLVELMIVVSIIGVLATLAVVGYRKYLNAAQASEVKGVFMGIKVGQEAYKAEMLTYLNVSANVDQDWYPNKTPNDKKYAWQQPGDPRYTTWRMLNVQPDGPVRFGYTVVAGVQGSGGSIPNSLSFTVKNWPPLPPVGTPWYVMQAKNQRNPGSPPVYCAAGSFGFDSGMVCSDESN